MGIRFITACCLLSLGVPFAAAQMKNAGAQSPAVGSIASPSSAFDSQLNYLEGEMMSAVKAMPGEKFGFAPSAAIFLPAQKTEFATVRTFAQQATHVARSNYSYATHISGLKPDVDVDGIDKLTAKADVVAALAGSFAFLHRAIGTLTPANSFEVTDAPMAGFFQTRATMAAFAVGHGFVHYGQMVEYLRMNGLVPPSRAR